MSTLDWSFVALVSGVLLFTFFGLVLLFVAGKNRKKLRLLKKKRPPKNKKKRRRFTQAKRKLARSFRKQLTWGLLLLVFAGFCSGGAMYSRYYQQNRLNREESEAIVQGYYILDELAKQLENVNKNENPQKSIKNIRNLSAKMVSFGFTKSSATLKEEKQVLLNRYFNTMKQLGTNLNEQTVEALQQEETFNGYMNDIKKMEDSQKEIFKQFKINEAALKQKQ